MLPSARTFFHHALSNLGAKFESHCKRIIKKINQLLYLQKSNTFISNHNISCALNQNCRHPLYFVSHPSYLMNREKRAFDQGKKKKKLDRKDVKERSKSEPKMLRSKKSHCDEEENVRPSCQL